MSEGKKEEFRNIENMTFKEVCELLNVKPITLIEENLACTKCPLFSHGCYGYEDQYVCKSKLKRFIEGDSDNNEF